MTDNPIDSSDSGFFDTTPVPSSDLQNDNTQTPPLGTCRKRKASRMDHCRKNLSDVLDCSSPQFSSTLNESLMNHLEKLHLENEQEKVSSHHVPSNKQFKSIENKVYSVPNTPDHQIKYSRDSINKKTNSNSFIKNLSQFGMKSQSPLNKEAYEILYPELLPNLEPVRKPTTPLKIDKGSIQAKKRLFYQPRLSPLKQILSNSVIMNKILKQLSNGDLYRLANVSDRFKEAILNDFESSKRFLEYTRLYPDLKENYRITPPNSPEKDEIDVHASSSSNNFTYFCEFAKCLKKNQSIIKCPKCQKVSIVESDIAQCQNVNGCGYIFCKKCDSFSTNPRDFIDKCNNAQLLNNSKRNCFGDLSNVTTSDYVSGDSSSFFSSSLNFNSSRYDSSESFSGCEVSTPKRSVKRNLSKSFMLPSEVKIFALNNRITDTPQPIKQTRRASLVPVVPIGNVKASVSEPLEPSSPPKNKQPAICSKQSKKNLKRLTQ